MYGKFANSLKDDHAGSRARKIRVLAGKALGSVNALRREKGHLVPRCRKLSTVKDCKGTSRGIYNPCKVVRVGDGGNKAGQWFCDFTVADEKDSAKKFLRIVRDMERRGQDLKKAYSKWGRTWSGAAIPRTYVSHKMTKKALREISGATVETVRLSEVGDSKRSMMNRVMQCDLLTPAHSSTEKGMRKYANECRRSNFCELVDRRTRRIPVNMTNQLLKKQTLADLEGLRCAPSRDLGPLRQYSLRMLAQEAKWRAPYIHIPPGHRRERGRLVLYELKEEFRMPNRPPSDVGPPGIGARLKDVTSMVLAGNIIGSSANLGNTPPLELKDTLIPCEKFTSRQCPVWPTGSRVRSVTGPRGRQIANPYRDIKHCQITFTGCREPTGNDRNPFSRYRAGLANPDLEYRMMTKALHDDIALDKRLPLKAVGELEAAFAAQTGSPLGVRLNTYKQARDLYDRIVRNAVPDEFRHLPPTVAFRGMNVLKRNLKSIINSRGKLNL
jgi:hypothetical protein